MKIIYKKIVEVVVRHDYYMSGLNAGTTIWPKDYDIRRDLVFMPSRACKEIMRNYKIKLLLTSRGFQLWAESVESVLSPNDFQTLVSFDPLKKLSFIVQVISPYFINFTNLRLTGDEDKIFYFNNRTINSPASISFLSKVLPTYPNPYSDETKYQLGDLIIDSGNIWEAKENINGPFPPAPLNPVLWHEYAVTDAQYITAQDQINRQNHHFTYRRSNNTPGEIIQFKLFDIYGNEVNLGNKSTGSSQSIYRTSGKAGNDVFHQIDLSAFSDGKYQLKIDGSVAEPDRNFYLSDPMSDRKVFGIIELFTDITTNDYRIFEHLPDALNPTESILRDQIFEIRFNNRTTVWKYLLKSGDPLMNGNPAEPVQPRLPLTKTYSGFAIDSNLLPDPSVSMIYPEKDLVDNSLISTINSEIYLNES